MVSGYQLVIDRLLANEPVVSLFLPRHIWSFETNLVMVEWFILRLQNGTQKPALYTVCECSGNPYCTKRCP